MYRMGDARSDMPCTVSTTVRCSYCFEICADTITPIAVLCHGPAYNWTTELGKMLIALVASPHINRQCRADAAYFVIVSERTVSRLLDKHPDVRQDTRKSGNLYQH